MPRRPVTQEVDADPTEDVSVADFALNDPPERTPSGELVKDGVVQRTGGKPKDEAVALVEAPKAPAAPVERDMEEIPGLPYVTVCERVLYGMVQRYGWEAVASDMLASVLVNMPRFYRALRATVRRGIYGDLQDVGQLTAEYLKRLTG